MPLHPRDPVGVARPLDAFDCAVGGVRGDTQIFARLLNRLVVGTVDDRLGAFSECAKTASTLERCGMRGIVFRFGLAFHHQVLLLMSCCGASFGLEVLNQCAAEIDVQELAAIANGQDRLLFSKRMPENGTVGFLSSYV